MSRTLNAMSAYAEGHVRRALAREEVRHERRQLRRSAEFVAAEALRARYGDDIAVYLFGSVPDAGRFKLDSDIDLAVKGLPANRYYEAWRLAEATIDDAPLDLVRIESSPGWLVAEIETRAELIA